MAARPGTEDDLIRLGELVVGNAVASVLRYLEGPAHARPKDLAAAIRFSAGMAVIGPNRELAARIVERQPAAAIARYLRTRSVRLDGEAEAWLRRQLEDLDEGRT